MIKIVMAQEIDHAGQRRLLEDVIRWEAMYRERAEGNDGHQYRVLARLLQDFRTFSEFYFKFYKTIGAKGLGIRAEVVQHQALERILDEWMVLSQVCEQRELSRYESWLIKADTWAATLLPPSQTPGTMVTYLGRASTLRHLPYSFNSVAGIPRDAYGAETQAQMAIAHEMGHHFWRLSSTRRRKEARLRERARQSVDQRPYGLRTLLDAWLEEVFADVLGCMVAQDVDHAWEFTTNYIERLFNLTERPQDLLASDHEHPFPYLRPLIRAKTLAHLDPGKGQVLKDKWRQRVKALGGVDETNAVEFFVPSVWQPGDRGFLGGDDQSVDRKLQANNPGQDPPGEHWHQWQQVAVPLGEIWAGLEAMIDEVIIPFADQILTPGSLEEDASQHDPFTFDWLFRDYLVNVAGWVKDIDTVEEALKLLAQPISELLGQESLGADEGGKFVGTHSHGPGKPTHTHK